MTKTRPSVVIKPVTLLACKHNGRVEKKERKSGKSKFQLLSVKDAQRSQDAVVDRQRQRAATIQPPLPKRVTRRDKKSCEKRSTLNALNFEQVDDELKQRTVTLPECPEKCEATRVEDLTAKGHRLTHLDSDVRTLDTLVCDTAQKSLTQIANAETSHWDNDQHTLHTASHLDTSSQLVSGRFKKRKDAKNGEDVTEKKRGKSTKDLPLSFSENSQTTLSGTHTPNDNNDTTTPMVLLNERVSCHVSAEKGEELLVDADLEEMEYPQPATYSQRMQRQLAREKQLQDMRTRDTALARRERFLRRQGLLQLQVDRERDGDGKGRKSIQWKKESDLVEVYLYSPCSSSGTGSTLDPGDIPDLSSLS